MYTGDHPMQDSLFSQNDHKKRDLDRVIHNLGSKGMNLVKASELGLKDSRASFDEGSVTDKK